MESLSHTAEARGAETTPSCLPPSVALIVSELDSGCATQKEKLASHGASVPALPKATLFCSGPSSTRIAQHASPPDFSSSSRRRTLRRGWEGAPGGVSDRRVRISVSSFVEERGNNSDWSIRQGTRGRAAEGDGRVEGRVRRRTRVGTACHRRPS